MNEEVKIERAPIDKALSELQATIQNFEKSYTSMNKEDNTGVILHKLEEIKNTFEQINSSYHALKHNNSKATNQAVEKMQGMDHTQSTSMY
ncbi:MAG: DUF5344 family protein [Bacillota bacterium]|uniref:DUF5344 family protein n=1 Tax=Virgibacillus TaxID=84406 RepID=UPI0004044BC0|nr:MULTISPECIES: Wadjet anti-phage system protein JetA family protein [Bacillaceae]MCC2248666.1 YwqI/YxiC family protein [Virgibacillus sp. AGTR]MDY7044957.1 DUF5344 family protein [Virgibacillus sp. M23]QRZ18422.1 YwqI/YxiC family protein [Virgibacillus sp. AGTR]